MRGLVVFIVAKVLVIILYPIGFVYSICLVFVKSGWRAVDTYFFNCAIADDQQGNTYLAKLFNDILIKPGGYRFGIPDETISSVLGRNLATGTLTVLGKGLNFILESLDPGHSTRSIEQLPERSKNRV